MQHKPRSRLKVAVLIIAVVVMALLAVLVYAATFDSAGISSVEPTSMTDTAKALLDDQP